MTIKPITIMNTESQLGDLEDPKLKKIGQRAVRQMALAASRVAAHDADGKRFPLPAQRDSIETTLAAWFDTMPAGRKAAAANDAVQQLTTLSVLRSSFGELSKIDLTASTSVASQASSIPLPNLEFTAAEIAKLTAISHGGGLSPQLERSNRLRLRVNKVWCANETNSPFVGEAGRDDMWVGGTSVDETGDTVKEPPIKLGQFDNKQTKTYSPPLEFANFNITEGSAFPKSYLVTLVLCEKDDGKKFKQYLDKIQEAIKQEVRKELLKAGVDFGPIGIILAEIAAWCFGELVDYISSGWKDTVFRPVTVRANIGGYEAVWNDTKRKDSKNRMLQTKAPAARYQLWYDWQLYSGTGPE